MSSDEVFWSMSHRLPPPGREARGKYLGGVDEMRRLARADSLYHPIMVGYRPKAVEPRAPIVHRWPSPKLGVIEQSWLMPGLWSKRYDSRIQITIGQAA
jgi:hypothetical protein